MSLFIIPEHDIILATKHQVLVFGSRTVGLATQDVKPKAVKENALCSN